MSASPQPTPKIPGGAWKANSAGVSDTLPWLSKRIAITRKGFLIPGIVTVVTSCALTLTAARPFVFDLILAAYLCIAGMYVTYRFCGRTKSTAVLIGVAIATIILNYSYLYSGIPMSTEQANALQTANPVSAFFTIIFRIGVPEELLKSIAVFAALLIGTGALSGWRSKVQISEPLDGILLAVASGTAFAFAETLVVYTLMPILEAQSQATQMGPVLGPLIGQSGVLQSQLQGLEGVILRLMDNVAGHAAYSGIFGYYIGLSVLKPQAKWKLLGIGFATAVLLHSCWDFLAFGQLGFPGVLTMPLIGVASFFVLAAAILKGRQISPTRAENWATTTFETAPQAAQAHQPPQMITPPTVTRGPAAQGGPPATTNQKAGVAFKLTVADQTIVLAPENKVREGEIAGLVPKAADGLLAEVRRHPKDPSLLGLKNLSASAWAAMDTKGQIRTVAPGQSVPLAVGMRINFGSIFGVIQS